MKKKKIGIVISVFVILALSVVTVFAIVAPEDAMKSLDRYDELSMRNAGYKERAAQMGKYNVEDVKVLYPGNADEIKSKKINALTLDKMEGYVAVLKEEAYYISKELMTYGELLQSDEAIDLDPTISKDRLVWVTKAFYPNDIKISGGYIETAHETKYWDAETGDFIGATIRSLNPDGTVNPNGFHKERRPANPE